MENQQSENQEIIQPKKYKDLGFKERKTLNKEFYGNIRQPILLLLLMLLGILSMITAIVFLLMGFKSTVLGESNFHVLQGYSFGSLGIIIMLPCVQLIEAKRTNKNLFKQYGKKICVILIIAFIVGVICCALQFIALIYKIKWLYYVGLIPTSVAALTHAIFILKNTKKNNKEYLNKDKKFCEWLEKYKNIIKENRILK